ncbi:MAG TPA: inositol monophosphatase family protein [Anaerolineales bacterium]|jgi:myo-inositol-1(or 4)-monophosphatase|nr:inositol monophosphatase family protein [Anaerolineales bacterium]
MPSPNISILVSLIREAGGILLAGYRRSSASDQSLQVEHKGEIDLVTELDYQAESFLLEEIKTRFPGHRVVTEESGAIQGDQDHLWYIDPLDGTVNFVHGLPVFSVSVAYAQAGVLTLGAVYDPLREECFTAERERGAWLNGEPIRVSDVKALKDSLLVTGFPYDIRTNPDNNLDHFVHFSLRAQGVRRLGSAALDLCYVAAGRLDGFWEIRLNAWDVAAGGLIVQEAGARVTDIHGKPDFLTTPQSIVAANPTLHPLMLEVLNSNKP